MRILLSCYMIFYKISVIKEKNKKIGIPHLRAESKNFCDFCNPSVIGGKARSSIVEGHGQDAHATPRHDEALLPFLSAPLSRPGGVTSPFSCSSLRLCPALAGLPPPSPVPLCAFAPLRYIPLPFFPPPRPYTPESDGLPFSVIPQLSAGRRAAQSCNVMGRMPIPPHVATRPFSRSSLRLCPALAGLPPPSPVPLCAFAPPWRGYLPFLLFLSAPLPRPGGVTSPFSRSSLRLCAFALHPSSLLPSPTSLHAGE